MAPLIKVKGLTAEEAREILDAKTYGSHHMSWTPEYADRSGVSIQFLRKLHDYCLLALSPPLGGRRDALVACERPSVQRVLDYLRAQKQS